MTNAIVRMVTFGSVGLAAALVAAPASAQDVQSGPNGTWEVHFPGPCTVYYDRTGNRTYDTPPCNSSDRRVADAAVRARLGGGYGNQGYPPAYPGGGYRPGYGAAEPRVQINNGGWGIVDLRNGCIVTFNRDGTRIHDTGRCNSQMRVYAQRLFQQRASGGGYRPGYGNNGYARPDLRVSGNRITVRMTGTNCTYIYSTGGNHIQSLGNQCNSRLRDVANQAVREWRNRGRY
ncbi:MAG: hypothetical protein ABI412_00400 [Sphingomicrobium sp.]